MNEIEKARFSSLVNQFDSYIEKKAKSAKSSKELLGATFQAGWTEGEHHAARQLRMKVIEAFNDLKIEVPTQEA